MADYRQIHTRIWKDSWFLSLTPEEKPLFICLFGNERASVAGIYELSMAVIVFETGLDEVVIKTSLETFSAAGKVFYENDVIWVVNMRKYNDSGSSKVKVKVDKDFAEVTVDKAEKLNQHVGQRSAMKLVEIKQGVQIVVVGSCGSQLVAARDQGKKLPFCNEEDDLTHTYRNCFRLGTLTFCTSSSCDQYEYIQYACPICDPEREAEMVAHFLSQSGLQPNEYQWTLDHLAQFDGKMRAVAAAKQLVAVATNLAGWVFLYGNYGVGKSELMKATVAALCRAGIPAIYRRADDILSEAKAIFTNDQEVQDASERAIKTRNGRYQILAIDEVDCISSTA